MSASILIIFAFLVVVYLSLDNLVIDRVIVTNTDPIIPPIDLSNLMQFLTQHKSRVEKDYTRTPLELSNSHFNVHGRIVDNSHAEMKYDFPLINSKISRFTCLLWPEAISQLVDSFGTNTQYIENNGDGIRYLIPQEPNEFNRFKNDLEAGCWYVDDTGHVSLDYNRIVANHKEFSLCIANHIHHELNLNKLDTYFNRVQSALNFVQHIPYGLPDFDDGHFKYLGIALPAESLVLNYSDCDSKSIFFASILCNLLDAENVVLVECVVSDSTGRPSPHMMTAVKGLNITYGQHIEFDNERYSLLETTRPNVIGDWNWNSFEMKKIINLQS